MQDPEFENNVRRKMEELKFSPSASVWSNVEKEIKKDNRSRRPILWLFLFLFIAGSGSFYFFKNTGTPGELFKTSKNLKKLPSSPTAPGGKDKSQPKIDNSNIATPGQANSKNTIANIPLATAGNPDNRQLTNANAKPSANNKISSNGGSNHGLISAVNKEEKADSYAKRIVEGKDKKNKAVMLPENSEQKPVDKPVLQNQFADRGSKIDDKSDSKPGTAQTQDTKSNLLPVKQNMAPVAKKHIGKDTASSANATALHKIEKKKKGILIGFTGNAGVSAVNENLFHTALASTGAQYYSFSTTARSLSAYYAVPSYYSPSTIKPGFSFSAGAFIEKPLTSKLSLSVGLNYHYYSTSIQTGAKINAPINVNSFYVPMAINSYYGYGAKTAYNNRYHFMEIPVTFSYQFNIIKKLPVSLEAGLSYGRLISSNELHFDNLTGVYYKDNSLFHKTQFNVNSGIMISLHHRNLSFQLGPQVQYGLTNLLTGNANNKQHLLFGGIKLNVFLKKK